MMMKTCLLTGTLAIFACCSLIGLAQEGSKPAAPKSTSADKADPKADGPKKGRLPANYGKLNLTEPQKTKIYGLQAQYDDQLDALEKQIATLKGKRDQEVEAVLNGDQRKVLSSLVDAAKNAKKPKEPTDSAKPTSSPEPKK